MRDNYAIIIKTRGKQIGDCPIQLIKYLIVMMIQKNLKDYH